MIGNIIKNDSMWEIYDNIEVGSASRIDILSKDEIKSLYKKN